MKYLTKIAFQVILLSFISTNTYSQFKLLKDINAVPNQASSSPKEFVEIGDYFYYIAQDNEHGVELWKSDGTEQGTTLVSDIRVGLEGSSPSNLTQFNGVLFFTADDGIHGRELWKSDGTEDGTTLVVDSKEGKESHKPGLLTVAGDILYFVATDVEVDIDVPGSELWTTDGTLSGTHFIRAYADQLNGTNMSYLTELNDDLYFAIGSAIWKSDGTFDGTIPVKRLEPMESRILNLEKIGSSLYFMFDDGIHGRELWKSDGTQTGTFMLKDVMSGSTSSTPLILTEVNESFYFFAIRPGAGRELWKSDGTESGTVLVKEADSNSKLGTNLIGLNGLLYFRTEDATGRRFLWKTDGTPEGTVLISQLGERLGHTITSNVEAVGNHIFFRAITEENGRELWKSDGTEAGTVMVKDIWLGSEGSDPTSLFRFNELLIFMANDGNSGIELWKSDGTETGTSMIKNINRGGGSSIPSNFTHIGNTTFFIADDGIHGRELWKTDDTPEGTQIVSDIATGQAGSCLDDLVGVSGSLFFVADDGIHGKELWKSDGTEEGTSLVKDIFSGEEGSFPNHLTSINGTLYFTANNSINGTELWKSDGTEEGTILIKDIFLGEGSSSIDLLTDVNNLLFFRANDGIHDQELWKSDGTENGTVLVKDIRQEGSSFPRELTVSNGILYFIAQDPVYGLEVWKSDGTESGTVVLKDIYEGTFSSFPGRLTSVGNSVFFAADNGISGSELWTSDGTEQGTFLVKDILPGDKPGSSVFDLTNVSGTLFFIATTESGQNLWKSDGTEEGTSMVKDIKGVRDIIETNGMAYFRAPSGSFSEYQLWQSDGTVEGTQMLELIEGGGKVESFYAKDRLLYVVRESIQYGSEIFTYFIKYDQEINFPEIVDKVYGDIPFDLGASSTSQLEISYEVSDESIAEIQNDNASIKGAGTVTITATQHGDDQHQAAKQVKRTFKIEKAILEANAEVKNKIYGTENPPLTIDYHGFAYNEKPEVLDQAPEPSTDADINSSVGEYEVTMSEGIDGNYEIIEKPSILTVEKAPLTVTAENKSRKYGEDNPGLTIDYHGLVGNESPDVLDQEPELSVEADVTSNVGDYEITVSGGVDDNYEIIGKPGILSIEKAPLTITAENKSRKYGEENPELTIDYEGFVNGENIGALQEAPTIETQADETSSVGEYEIVLSEVMDKNYELIYNSGLLTVTKAELKVTANDQSKIVGEANPELTLTYDGFVNGDDQTSIIEPIPETTADENSPPGEYPITFSGGSAENYEFTFVEGILTIKQILGFNNLAGEPVSIYPNPSQSHIYFNIEGQLKTALYDLHGKLILLQDVTIKEGVNLANFEAGQYIIKLWDKNRLVYQGKVIKTD